MPTMGSLHEGHLSLIRRAREETDLLIVSIFVNPSQFGKGEDFDKYPRDFRKDKKLALKEGVDIIFYPGEQAMYPDGFRTSIKVAGLADSLCGRFRPGHFEGVATVVAKLFNIVEPDIAYFGQKDYQQARIIKQLAKDLDMNIKIKVLPIMREQDGLALSSRNKYLSPEQRKKAALIYAALKDARKKIASGQKSSAKITAAIKKKLRQAGFKIDYVELVRLDDLSSVKRVNNKVLLAVAARLGRTRLIDNIIIG